MRLAFLLTLIFWNSSVAVFGKDGSQCDMPSSLLRLDCYPENGSEQNKCLARGCCWKLPTADELRQFPQLNIPYCYYPQNYVGYEVVNQTKTSNGATIFLKRGVPSNVDVDIQSIRVDVIQQADSILRIRMLDPSADRWEPPLPSPPSPIISTEYSYSFALNKDGKFEVFRQDNNRPTTKIVSLNLASMVYTDRFIQITNTLPSNILYGLGEHKGRLRRSMNFTLLTFYNEDRIPEYGTRLYGTQPLYINIEADGRANGMWLLSSNALDIILTPGPTITYRPVGGILDFFLFTGPTPANVVQQYQEIVGKPSMVPYWALGYHLCRFGYRNTEDTRQVLQNNLNAGIRVDVQWNDIDYMKDRNDFTIDPVNYKDLGQFVRNLHNDGRHYIPIIDPAVSGSEKPSEYPPFDRGVYYDVFVKDSKGKIVYGKVWNLKSSVFPDFTHPNATAYWTEMFQNFYKEVPFDGAWIDMNEPSNMINGHINEGCPADKKIVYTPGDEPLDTKTLCTTDQHHWSSHYNVHNMYGFTEALATYKALSSTRPNKRPFIISRSTFSGQGVYSGHWTGDVWSSWTDLKDSVSGILEFSFYGIPMVGADICGFNGNTTVDLCARWQALGAFYPFSRNHNTDNGIAQDPASMGDKVIIPTRTAYYWRYKLLPYLYTLFYRAHTHGETVARPLFFDSPADSATYDNDDQFMWGDALMVVPALYKDQKKINAYFPRGIWYDLQNRTALVDASKGGKTVVLSAYNDTINFFMKGGHSVFFQEPEDTTTESRTNPFGLYVFLCENNSSTGEVFIDDGESTDSITSGHYHIVKVIANNQMLILGTTDNIPVLEIIDRIHVYGIKSEPKHISVTMDDFNDFTYDPAHQLLTLYNLNSSMKFLSVIFYF
ncbi:lysosomal alpha-glucosidase-like [Tropilaelaps mercedesae]|uniref:Lysosomal alpha-glucosidase-like n=1 Tax=Tropilaelaps mercedesae TaxID=418985 RepID=A0A1V9XNG8_9ACAR|nr:lysosomal alpha-glucosidase-like [Tropilaelaps mercedesae]